LYPTLEERRRIQQIKSTDEELNHAEKAKLSKLNAVWLLSATGSHEESTVDPCAVLIALD